LHSSDFFIRQSSIFSFSQLNMHKKIYLSSPHMGGGELKYIHQAFEENWIAPLGPNVDGFEEDICRYTGAGHAAALSSGTAAIHLALILLGVQAGDEVSVPPSPFLLLSILLFIREPRLYL
jgi:dTDP-4-amino-4,6-dideoxygalactose transaminase